VKPLEPIVNLLKKQGYKAIVCDESKEDGSILPLKLAAIRAGLGWQGKHTLLISKKYGTFLALGGIITDAALKYNTDQEPNRCHECEKCQEACPLGALDRPYVLNRENCLSNLLQIEHLPEEAQAVTENRVGDCEICQEACPWNKKHLDHPLATNMTESFLKEIEAWETFFSLPDLIHITEEEYREKLGHLNTGIPYNLFHRNASMAMKRAKNRKHGLTNPADGKSPPPDTRVVRKGKNIL
jgi:epoxyqueuosine reductase